MTNKERLEIIENFKNTSDKSISNMQKEYDALGNEIEDLKKQYSELTAEIKEAEEAVKQYEEFDLSKKYDDKQTELKNLSEMQAQAVHCL